VTSLLSLDVFIQNVHMYLNRCVSPNLGFGLWALFLCPVWRRGLHALQKVLTILGPWETGRHRLAWVRHFEGTV